MLERKAIFPQLSVFVRELRFFLKQGIQPLPSTTSFDSGSQYRDAFCTNSMTFSMHVSPSLKTKSKENISFGKNRPTKGTGTTSQFWHGRSAPESGHFENPYEVTSFQPSPNGKWVWRRLRNFSNCRFLREWFPEKVRLYST